MTEPDSYQSAMLQARENMVEADRLAAAGRHKEAAWLSNMTMQAAMALSFSESLFQARMQSEAKKAPEKEPVAPRMSRYDDPEQPTDWDLALIGVCFLVGECFTWLCRLPGRAWAGIQSLTKTRKT